MPNGRSFPSGLSLQAISHLMSDSGFHASPYTVEQLLGECKLGQRQAFKYLTMRQHKDRAQQFDTLLLQVQPH